MLSGLDDARLPYRGMTGVNTTFGTFGELLRACRRSGDTSS
ncbi:hypothetical protein [Streptomyces diacarni]|nr:hypothetical protein [Streptomyces diacarni]